MKCIDSIVQSDLFPSGVFEQFDTIGLDVVHPSVQRYAEYAGDTGFYEPLIRKLDRLVSNGMLGCKSGEGFYRYEDRESHDTAACEEPVRREISSVLRALYINSACRALEARICSRDELEFALKEYTDAEKGPFAILDETGTVPVRELLSARYAVTGFSAFKPSDLLDGLGHQPA
jgi:3-hydroxyacyl-CoA dehydrogenase